MQPYEEFFNELEDLKFQVAHLEIDNSTTLGVIAFELNRLNDILEKIEGKLGK
jgi:hypothetical protein